MSTHTVEYVVFRLNWLGFGGDVQRLPGQRRMASFADERLADEDCRRREAEVRSRVNPFRCGGHFRYLSSFPWGVYLDWLRDADIEIAADMPFELVAWWDQTQATLTAFQRDRVWQGLDKVRFFEVQTVNPARRGYAVVARQWNYNDSWYESPALDGGRPLRVFRTWASAEVYRREREQEMRGRVQNERVIVDLDYRDERGWPFRGGELLADAQNASNLFYDLVEIDIATNADERP